MYLDLWLFKKIAKGFQVIDWTSSELKVPVVATSRSEHWMAGSERDLEWLMAGNEVLLVLPLVNPFFFRPWCPAERPTESQPPPSTKSSAAWEVAVPFWGWGCCCWGCCGLFKLLEVVFLRPTTKLSLSLFWKGIERVDYLSFYQA